MWFCLPLLLPFLRMWFELHSGHCIEIRLWFLPSLCNAFKATYLYGIVEPKTGAHFFFEFSHLNTDCFQVFLNLVSQQFKDDLLIIQLDNGAFHKAKRLQVPANIILLFQPPHCPELNPIEQVWQYLKRRLRWSLPVSLDQLRQQLNERLEALTPEVVASITGRLSILQALSVAQI